MKSIGRKTIMDLPPRISALGLLGLALLCLASVPSAVAGQRPLSDFLLAQGTYVVTLDANGNPDCAQSHYKLPSEPVVDWWSFVGWVDPKGGLGMGIDYAGVANAWLQSQGAASLGTTFAGSVNEKPLPDGRAEVSVVLHTHNALATANGLPWVDPDSVSLFFGYTAPEVLAGAEAALAAGGLKRHASVAKRPGNVGSVGAWNVFRNAVRRGLCIVPKPSTTFPKRR